MASFSVNFLFSKLRYTISRSRYLHFNNAGKSLHLGLVVSLAAVVAILIAVLQPPSHSQAQQASCGGVPSGLIGWWPADGSSSDVKGGRDGKLEGGAGYASGRFGQAFNFDGVDDFISTELNIIRPPTPPG